MTDFLDVSVLSSFNQRQHCTNADCFTFSHTYTYCGRPQPRFCWCPYDYPEESW